MVQYKEKKGGLYFMPIYYFTTNFFSAMSNLFILPLNIKHFIFAGRKRNGVNQTTSTSESCKIIIITATSTTSETVKFS